MSILWICPEDGWKFTTDSDRRRCDICGREVGDDASPITPRIVNDPARKGDLAARKRLFGGNSRFAIAPVHTRFDAVEWMVWDAHRDDGTGRPEVIRQAATEAEALEGLPA